MASELSTFATSAWAFVKKADGSLKHYTDQLSSKERLMGFAVLMAAIVGLYTFLWRLAVYLAYRAPLVALAALIIAAAYEAFTMTPTKKRKDAIAAARSKILEKQAAIESHQADIAKIQSEIAHLSATMGAVEVRDAEVERMRSACVHARASLEAGKFTAIDADAFRLLRENPAVAHSTNTHLTAYSKEGATVAECLAAIEGLLTAMEQAGL